MRRALFFLLGGVGLVGVAFGVYFITINFHKPVYISPLAGKITSSLPPSIDKNLSLLKKGLTDKNIEYTAIKPSNGAYIVALTNGSEVTFSAKKDIMLQISSLQFILSRLTMEGKLFSRLDLRFDKPVIVTK